MYGWSKNMDELPKVQRKYELLFTPHLIKELGDLRGEEWNNLIKHLSTLHDTHPDAIAFALMMVELDNCLTCEMDSYRAQRGCLLCARQAILSFKGTDEELLQMYDDARKQLSRQPEIKRADLDIDIAA